MIIDPMHVITSGASNPNSLGWVGAIGSMGTTEFKTSDPYFVSYLSLPKMPLDTTYTFEFYDKDGMPRTMEFDAKDITYSIGG